VEAGVTPTWYVDADSLQDYKSLGLQAVVGGKLTPSRNKALKDARSKGKVCVQVSDDISAWEYRDGKKATERTDDAVNAAHHKARRYIVSPVAAARFILAKMRSAENPKPKLGGIYMLGSCSRTFGGDAFVRNHFILGDFFVVDKGSRVNFDENMRLKEDYDFSCAHIKAHGSVMRCNRMTINVKHYDNGGGAVTNRDGKGKEEKRNIAILQTKWPGVFRANPKRKNEVIMRWKVGSGDDVDDDGEEAQGNGKQSAPSASSLKKRPAMKVASVKKTVQKTKASSINPNLVLARTDKEILAPHVAARVKRFAGKRVGDVLKMTWKLNGEVRQYKIGDLKYDLVQGYLVKRRD